MKFIVALICVAFAVAGCIADAGVQPTATTFAQYLMSKQVNGFAFDLAGGLECFTYYVPLLSNAATVWSDDYQQCLQYAENNRTLVMQEISQEQELITEFANGVCSSINNCQTIKKTLDYFMCFSELSDNGVLQAVYAISNDATILATSLSQELEVINLNLNICKNSTERAYVETTAAIYNEIDNCLKNGLTTSETTTPGSTTVATPSTPGIVGTDVPVPPLAEIFTNKGRRLPI